MPVARFATHLWYDHEALEAAELYTRLLPDSHIDRITNAPEGVPNGVEAGSVFFVDVTLRGQQFILLNGGPGFPFNAQVSLYVCLDTQEEVDRMWDALLAGGAPQQCGWIADRFGLSWQVIPKRFEELMADPDPAVVRRVTDAMLRMVKLETAELEAAARAA